MSTPADASAMPPPRTTRANRPARYDREESGVQELKQTGRKRGRPSRTLGAAGPHDQSATVGKGGLDAQEAKRQRRLEQNRIAAKKAYDKRVKRQADMEREYESLRQQLQETNAQAATLGAFISQTGLAGQLCSGKETPPQGQDVPTSPSRSRQPAPSTSVPVAKSAATVGVPLPAEPAGPGTQYRRVQSIEALTSLVSMVDESSGKPA